MAGMGMKGIRNEVHRPWRTGHQFSLASAACHSRVPSHLVCLCPSRLSGTPDAGPIVLNHHPHRNHQRPNRLRLTGLRNTILNAILLMSVVTK